MPGRVGRPGVAGSRGGACVLAAALLAAVALLLAGRPAAAGTAIYYSETDSGYGWCSEVGSDDATKACARRYCEQSGNHDCALALDCARGWAAVAATDNGYRHAAVCARGNPVEARHQALLLCIAMSGRLCHTDAAFFGSSEISEAQNRAFDMAWYAQILLAHQGYDVGTIDGAAGPRLRRAVQRFQADAKLPQNGAVDQALLQSLIAREGGWGHLAAAIRRSVEAQRDAADRETEFVSGQVAASGGGQAAPDADQDGGGRDGGQPSRGGDEPSKGGDQSGNGGDQPANGGDQPADGGGQPGKGGDQPAGDDGDRSPGGGKGSQ